VAWVLFPHSVTNTIFWLLKSGSWILPGALLWLSLFTSAGLVSFISLVCLKHHRPGIIIMVKKIRTDGVSRVLCLVTRRDCHNSVNELSNRKQESESPAKTFCLQSIMRQPCFINIVEIYLNRTLCFPLGCESDDTKIRMCLLVWLTIWLASVILCLVWKSHNNGQKATVLISVNEKCVCLQGFFTKHYSQFVEVRFILE
jgi:hypothetical protein